MLLIESQAKAGREHLSGVRCLGPLPFLTFFPGPVACDEANHHTAIPTGPISARIEDAEELGLGSESGHGRLDQQSQSRGSGPARTRRSRPTSLSRPSD